ncbi:Zinc finger DNA binding protein [Operophtera brumata]|uniref:Zinc finger DNA binding protein n=1 Tax=Operophtera brumata TaxID=104452 RepID=A0A0L7LG83_OPEBR|nr:Zinc finger DNA binding protein [Operophtera brumata]
MDSAISGEGKMIRTPPRPLNAAVSQPDIYGTPELQESDLKKTVRKRKYTDDTTHSMNDMFSNVLQMFKELKTSQDEQFSKISEEIGSLKTQNEILLKANAEIKSSLTFIAEEQNELKTRVDDLEKREKSSQMYVCELEEQLENVERKIRERSIEINNLTTENNEDMMTAIEKIHKTLKLEYDSRDIRSAYRITTKANRPRPIIIEYTTTQKKITLLRAFKEFNKIEKAEKFNTSTIGVAGVKQNIYINELLTKKARHLHYLARDLIKRSSWKFCWSAKGKIFIRKEEGQPAVELKSEDQIKALENSKGTLD